MAQSNNNTLEMIFYAGGDLPKPEVNTSHLRLYGHNLCPFTTRARYTLAAKGIPFQQCMVDLHHKGQWHSAFNGGTVPILETPQGDLIPETAIIMQYALESSPAGGIQLVPSDPVEAAKMRVKMEEFMKNLGPLLGVVLSCGNDVGKINAYKETMLPQLEQMATEANGKFLLATDDITLYDIHCAPLMELIFLFEKGVYADVDAILQIRTNAPNWVAYMERFRAHPVIKPVRMNAKASQLHGARSRAWDPTQKCHLCLEVLEGVWPDEQD